LGGGTGNDVAQGFRASREHHRGVGAHHELVLGTDGIIINDAEVIIEWT